MSRNIKNVNKETLLGIAKDQVDEIEQLKQAKQELELSLKTAQEQQEETVKSMMLQRQNTGNPQLEPNQINGFLRYENINGKDLMTTKGQTKRHVRIQMNYKGTNIDTIMPIYLRLGKTSTGGYYFSGYIQDDNNNPDVTIVKVNASTNSFDFKQDDAGNQQPITQEEQFRNQKQLDESK